MYAKLKGRKCRPFHHRLPPESTSVQTGEILVLGMLRGGFAIKLARSTPSLLQMGAVSAASSHSASAASSRSVSHLSWPSSPMAGRGRGHSWLLRSQGAREASSIAGKWGGLGPNDPCLILGVNRNAGLEEIKKAYREKARNMHPDVRDKRDASPNRPRPPHSLCPPAGSNTR